MADKNNKKKKSSKEIALDKFDIDTSSNGKKTSKTPKTKNPFKRFAIAMFPQKTDTKNEIFRKVLLLVAIAVLIGTLAFLIWQLKGMSDGGKKTIDLANSAGASFGTSISYREPNYIVNPGIDIPTTAGTEEPEFIDLTPYPAETLNVDFDYLKSINPDVRAWVKIPGTLVNNAVLQRPGDDNYYINHDINGNESISGEVFASWRNKMDGTDDNIILYGHNMKSGYFFAYVRHYVPNVYSREPLAFYKVHPTISLQLANGESETYKVFAGVLANTQEQYGEVFNYTTKTNFSSAEEFNNYMIDIMDRSWFYTDVDLQYGDKILTLSTCHWPLGEEIDTRWAVFARKVRPGESDYVDTSVAQRNYSPKLFDYYYQLAGTQWNGSSWDTSKLLSY